MQIPCGLGLFSPLCGCRPLAKAIHPSASASGLFPLWLRAPRFISAALSSHSLPVGRELGAALVWGKEGILPPAPPHPRPFGFRRRTTPFLVFISVCSGVASASKLCDFDEGRRSSLAMDAHSGNSPEARCKCLPQVRSKTSGLLPPVRAREDSLFRFLNTRLPFRFFRLA